MIALALIALFALIASGAGQVILERISLSELRPLERFVYSGAIGLGIAAYGVFALGVCGLMQFPAITAWWTLLALFGVRGIRIQVLDLQRWWRERGDPVAANRGARWPAWVKSACIGVLIVMGVVACVAAFRPPGAVEWDVLAYHLADPKVFLQQQRITLLPTEHHSNFPFTVEMLFAVGLLYQGYALANLFHLLLAALTVLAVISFGERFYGHGAGFMAAVCFATCPLVLWESSVAYIDVGAALYTTLAALAAICAIDARSRAGSFQPVEDSAQGRNLPAGAATNSWLMLAGGTMGFALGIKYLALIPLILVAVLLQMRAINTGSILRYLLVAVVIGSPWYLKNALLMRNPVYPFYQRVFPQSRYWSPGRENSYRSEQEHFGYPHSLAHPREAIVNLLEAPWRLLAVDGRYFNRGETTFSALFGGMFGALCLAGLLLRTHRSYWTDLGFLAVTQFVAWFFLAQVGRYLIQVLPLFALIAGITAARLIRAAFGRRDVLGLALALTVGALFVGNVVVVFWSVTLLPDGGREANQLSKLMGMTADTAETTQVLPTALSLPHSLDLALHPDERERWLSRRLDVYDAEQYVNQHAKPGAGVVLYEETRGFYLNRPYLWGNDAHSSYIPYDTFRNGVDVTRWMIDHGISYAIINLNWSSKNREHRPISPDEAAMLLQEWYLAPDPPARQSDWFRTVGQAIRDHLWTVEQVLKGNVVLRIGPSEPRTGGVGRSVERRQG